MSRPSKQARVTNAPNSHPGHIRTSPLAHPQFVPVLTKWHGLDLVSLFPQDIYLVDPDTKVRISRIPASGLTYEVLCQTVPVARHTESTAVDTLLAADDTDQHFARLDCALPTLEPSANRNNLYVVSAGLYGAILTAYHMHRVPMSLNLAVPIHEENDTSGATIGYGAVLVLDRLADAPGADELCPEQARLFV